MRDDVMRLFDEYAARFARGERPDARAYLARAGSGEDELAALIERYLERVQPPRRLQTASRSPSPGSPASRRCWSCARGGACGGTKSWTRSLSGWVLTTPSARRSSVTITNSRAASWSRTESIAASGVSSQGLSTPRSRIFEPGRRGRRHCTSKPPIASLTPRRRLRLSMSRSCRRTRRDRQALRKGLTSVIMSKQAETRWPRGEEDIASHYETREPRSFTAARASA
jgi:hypothetical protein